MEEKAPDFCLPDYMRENHCLSSLGRCWVVLYFYPKDNTPGCTREAKEFSEKKGEFEKLNTVVIGVSKDSPNSHKKFIEKNNLTILLFSDEERKILEAYGVWGKKKNYGREYYGTFRSTFLIDPKGKIRKSWKKVRVSGHVDAVLSALKRFVE